MSVCTACQGSFQEGEEKCPAGGNKPGIDLGRDLNVT